MLSIPWSMFTLTGYGSLDNNMTEFDDMHRIQSASQNSASPQESASTTPEYIKNYNAYYERLHRHAYRLQSKHTDT